MAPYQIASFLLQNHKVYYKSSLICTVFDLIDKQFRVISLTCQLLSLVCLTLVSFAPNHTNPFVSKELESSHDSCQWVQVSRVLHTRTNFSKKSRGCRTLCLSVNAQLRQLTASTYMHTINILMLVMLRFAVWWILSTLFCSSYTHTHLYYVFVCFVLYCIFFVLQQAK